MNTKYSSVSCCIVVGFFFNTFLLCPLLICWNKLKIQHIPYKNNALHRLVCSGRETSLLGQTKRCAFSAARKRTHAREGQGRQQTKLPRLTERDSHRAIPLTGWVWGRRGKQRCWWLSHWEAAGTSLDLPRKQSRTGHITPRPTRPKGFISIKALSQAALTVRGRTSMLTMIASLMLLELN